MESLSRPLQRNHHASSANFSRKRDSNGFSSKHAYDDVLLAGPPKHGARTFSSRLEDYKEIFGTSRASSIPVLDLSDLDDSTNVSADFRTSNPDYSSIFVGFRDEDIGVSYDELFAGPRARRANNSSPAKTKSPSATKATSQHSGRLNSLEQNQSFDAVKQFNMSYHKTSQKSKDETKVTTHVAELRAVPGFACVIDETTPLHKTESGKQKPSAINDVRQKMDFGATSPLVKKQTSGGAVRSRSGSSWDGTYSNDKLFNAHETNLKSHPSKVSPPSSQQANLEKSKGPFKRSITSNKDRSPDSSDEELDVNSAAAASVAALRKAIEKAQESIRIAKELMEKKEDPLNYSKKVSKSSLKVKDRRKNSIAPQGNRAEEQNGKATCDERENFVLQSSTDMERKIASRSGEVAPDFRDGDIFSELVNTGKHRRAISAFEQADGNNNIMQSTGKHENKFEEVKTTGETLEQQEGFTEKAEVVEKAYELEEDMERKERSFKISQDREENLDKLESTYVVHEHEENEKPGTAQEVEETAEKQKSCEGKMENLLETAEDEEFFESQDWNEKDNETGLNGSLELVENVNKQEVPEQEIIEKRMKDAEFEENENMVREIQDEEVLAKRLQEAFQWVESEIRLREAFDGSSNEPKQKDAHAGEVIETRLDENENIQIEKDVSEENYRTEVDEKRPTDADDWKESEENTSVCEWEGIEKTVAGADGYEADENIEREINGSDENEEIKVEWEESEENTSVCEWEGIEKTVAGADGYEADENIEREINGSDEIEEIKVDEKRPSDAHDGKESEKDTEEWEREREGNEKSVQNIERETDGSEDKEEVEVSEEALNGTHFNRVSDASNSTSGTEDACQHEINENTVKSCPKVSDNNGSTLGVSKAFSEFEVDEAEEVEAAFMLNREEIKGDAEGDEKDERDDGNLENFGSTELDIGENQVEQNTEDSESASDIENGINVLLNEFRENDEIVKEGEIAFGVEEKSTPKTARRKRWFAENAKEMEASEVPKTAHRKRWFAENAKEMEVSEVLSALKENGRTPEIDEEIKTREDTEKKNEESLDKSFATEEKDYKENVSKEDPREIDEANKREREREKDRIVVERAIREARERAFAEARERAERAAVERANAEVRQRVMADAREKASSCAGTTNKSSSSSEKASQEAKLKAERAAVERATSEARKRALEKAKLSHKTTSEARPQPERVVNEKFSGASGDFSSSRFDGTNTESSLRSKAKLEKHQRIMQRAEKALAEKNMRDLLAQKEQAERNRLSESLDADIKRWSSGKEGNLRALLSTLQYVLGPGSGWQPVSLTDIVTTSAVRKAYRKATLYVHPDKLQQRGASIQQKYICEKVFDLLKAAWNKFNSEER